MKKITVLDVSKQQIQKFFGRDLDSLSIVEISPFNVGYLVTYTNGSTGNQKQYEWLCSTYECISCNKRGDLTKEWQENMSRLFPNYDEQLKAHNEKIRKSEERANKRFDRKCEGRKAAHFGKYEEYLDSNV